MKRKEILTTENTERTEVDAVASGHSVVNTEDLPDGFQMIELGPLPKRAIRKPDLWYHDGDHAVLMRSNLVCHDVHVDPIQPSMRPI